MSHTLFQCPQCGETWTKPHCPKCAEETTPDKTLEELASEATKEIVNNITSWRLSGSGSTAPTYNVIKFALQSATAAQQREVERVNGFREELRAKHHQLQDAFNELVSQLRTYGAHAPICRGADNCDCGFAEVQKGLNG